MDINLDTSDVNHGQGSRQFLEVWEERKTSQIIRR